MNATTSFANTIGNSTSTSTAIAGDAVTVTGATSTDLVGLTLGINATGSGVTNVGSGTSATNVIGTFDVTGLTTVAGLTTSGVISMNSSTESDTVSIGNDLSTALNLKGIDINVGDAAATTTLDLAGVALGFTGASTFVGSLTQSGGLVSLLASGTETFVLGNTTTATGSVDAAILTVNGDSTLDLTTGTGKLSITSDSFNPAVINKTSDVVITTRDLITDCRWNVMQTGADVQVKFDRVFLAETNDGAVSNMATITMAADSVYYFEVTMVAKNTVTPAQRDSFKETGMIYCNAAGSKTVMSSTFSASQPSDYSLLVTWTSGAPNDMVLKVQNLTDTALSKYSANVSITVIQP